MCFCVWNSWDLDEYTKFVSSSWSIANNRTHGRRSSDLKSLQLPKFRKKLHGSPRIFQTSFHGRPQNFKQVFIGVNGSPHHTLEVTGIPFHLEIQIFEVWSPREQYIRACEIEMNILSSWVLDWFLSTFISTRIEYAEFVSSRWSIAYSSRVCVWNWDEMRVRMKLRWMY